MTGSVPCRACHANADVRLLRVALLSARGSIPIVTSAGLDCDVLNSSRSSSRLPHDLSCKSYDLPWHSSAAISVTTCQTIFDRICSAHLSSSRTHASVPRSSAYVPTSEENRVSRQSPCNSLRKGSALSTSRFPLAQVLGILINEELYTILIRNQRITPWANKPRSVVGRLIDFTNGGRCHISMRMGPARCPCFPSKDPRRQGSKASITAFGYGGARR